MAAAAGPEDYKQLYEALLVEKKQMEYDFGQKRGQFKQLYLEIEGKWKNEKEISKQFEIQVKDLTKKIDDLKSENEGVRIAAQLSNETKQEELQSVKTSHNQELASLQHIFNEHAKENQSRLAGKFDEERHKLLENIRSLEQKVTQLEAKPSAADHEYTTTEQQQQVGLMSTLSSAFSSKKPVAGNPPTRQQKGDSPLDASQQQIQQNVDAWKSVVGPLEKEVEYLKKQLEESQHNKMNSENSVDVQEKLLEMKKTIDSERSARTDLEMYVNVLNTQKGVLQEDSDKLKRELHNVCRLFETEKMSHSELKQTWKLANEQFLAQQMKLLSELDVAKGLLSPQQREQLSKEMRKYRAEGPVQSNQAQSQQTSGSDVSSSSSSSSQQQQRQRHVDSGGGGGGGVLVNFNSPTTKRQSPPVTKDTLLAKSKQRTPQMDRKSEKLSDTLLNAFFPAAAQARQFNELIMKDAAMSEKPLVLSSSSEDSDDDDLVEAINKQNRVRYNVEPATEVEEAVDVTLDTGNDKTTLSSDVVDGISVVDNKSSSLSSPMKKSNSSGDLLMKEPALHGKSLSQGDVSIATTAGNTPGRDEVDSRVSLNESGWSTLSGDYHTYACMMCQNYEKQLQRLQKEFLGVKDNEKTLVDTVKTLKVDLTSEKEQISSLEKSIDAVNIDTKSQINIYNTNHQEVDKQVKLLHTQFRKFREDMVKEMKVLSEDRDKALAQYTSLSQECEAKSKEEAAVLSQEDEEQLKTEIMFLKDRVMAEQVDRESTESVLQQDLKDAQKQIAKLKSEIEKIQTDGSTENALLSF